MEEIPQMGPNFLTKISLFDPTFTFRGQKMPTFFVSLESLVFFVNHHVNRRLALETCREEEEINVKSFVKLQSCLEEVREKIKEHT